MLPRLKHLATFELDRAGDCQIIGVHDSGRIFVEEIYGEDDLLAQYLLSLSEGRIAAVDEGENTNTNTAFVPLAVPHDIIRPGRTDDFQQLDFAGGRRRGLAASERVDDLTRRLTISEKIELVDYLELDLDPARLIGIAESRIRAACQFEGSLCIVCRRVRIAFRLPKPRTDPGGQTYDYDSVPLYLLHPLSVTAEELPDLETCLRFTLEADLYRPQDCMRWQGKLIVADGGDESVSSALHVFAVDVDSYEPRRQPTRTEILEA